MCYYHDITFLSICKKNQISSLLIVGSRFGSRTQSRINSDGSLYSAPAGGPSGTNRDNPLLLRQSCLRIGEDSIVDRCSRCGVVKEEYR